MNISKEQLHFLPKRIGHIDGVPVFETMTKGGLVLLILGGGAGKLVAAGPHRGFAIPLAKQRHPEFVLDELSKSEKYDDISAFKHLMPVWSDIVDRVNNG